MSSLREEFEAGPEARFLDVLKELRALMSNDPNRCPVVEFIDSGMLPYVVHFLRAECLHMDEHWSQALW